MNGKKRSSHKFKYSNANMEPVMTTEAKKKLDTYKNAEDWILANREHGWSLHDFPRINMNSDPSGRCWMVRKRDQSRLL